jgi:hypothetical protein
MGYLNRRFSKSPPLSSQYSSYANTVSDPAIKDRIEKLLSNAALCEFPKTVEFMQSLLQQYNLRGKLSHKQMQCIEENEKRYSNENVAIRDSSIEAWKAEYDAVKRANFIAIANFYKKASEDGTQPYYYRDVLENILSNENYVPSKQSYEKIIVNNKYAQSYLKQKESINKFRVDDVVIMNTAGKNRSQLVTSSRAIAESTFIIVEVTDTVRACVGSRLYKVIPIGDDSIISIEERYLKKYTA